MTDYSYSYTTTGDSAAALGVFGAFFAVYMIVVLAVAVVGIIGLWKTFVKAGQPGWAAIIPIYNFYILLKVIGRPTWWLALLLLAIVPFVGPIALMVVYIVIALDVAKSFGKSPAFGIIALWLFSIVGYLILGFGDAKYVGPAAAMKK
jgi:hypothetical protein